MRQKMAGFRKMRKIRWVLVLFYAVSVYFTMKSRKSNNSLTYCVFLGACSWNRAAEFFRHAPSSNISNKPCFRWLHQYKVRFSRVKAKERLLSDSYVQPKSRNACQSKVGLCTFWGDEIWCVCNKFNQNPMG